MVELLAPARDLACGLAAINCGADAVYIGAARFGARASAGNPLADVEALVKHAHAYWARVYVTVNTLLRDDELPEALRLIRRLYQIGADGLIIQDVGLLECDLPPLPLIASTQMHNHTPERVAFLEQVGFQRVILARELDLEQIKAIRRRTNIELECFVHGALCVCYSGQCAMSYAIGGRSGNRGECAQPCRRRYSLVDRSGQTLVRDRYPLSLRDLNLTDHLADLLDAGVTAFKIEGRLEETSDGFSLSATDEDGNTATALLRARKIRAQQPERALDNARRQLARMGDTGFACAGLEIAWSEAWFLPLSVLNRLRRQALEALAAARARNRPALHSRCLDSRAGSGDIPFPEQRLTYLGNVLNRKAEAFYRRHGVTHIEPAAESGLDMRGRKVMTTRYCIKHQLGWCQRDGSAPPLLEPLYLLDEDGRRYALRFDCAACQMEIIMSV